MEIETDAQASEQVACQLYDKRVCYCCYTYETDRNQVFCLYFAASCLFRVIPLKVRMYVFNLQKLPARDQLCTYSYMSDVFKANRTRRIPRGIYDFVEDSKSSPF